MQLDWLADVHRDAGLTVIEHTGWKTRTMRPFDDFHPVGLINHHTAGYRVIPNYPDPPFYRNSALETKCNVTIRPDGVVVILNAGYAYDSGYGAPEVLSAVRNDRPLPSLRGLDSTLLGNAWFIDNEVQHLGNGDPIEPVQRDALIRSNAATCEYMEWDPRYRLIGHLEWAPDRKVDPRWDGFANPMPQIREDTRSLIVTEPKLEPEEDLDMPIPTPAFVAQLTPDDVVSLCRARTLSGRYVINPSNNDRAREAQYYLQRLPQPGGPLEHLADWANFHNAVLAAGEINGAAAGSGGATASQVAAELAERLSG